ncbi:hypothetical protein RHMOL_Rhmol11G0055900 [Rhododendron molle]|uniref:Uncharacterized protein n=1 Tax=Rhododendron molle TaxID=49168 RepID=A0ACC0LPB1_RHOML|nr:hypothetical protein RHMOL_Rhmol11G0055900 [Rhododendron molle]
MDIPTDFWDFDDSTTSWWDIANVTRSGRVFQPPNLQAGSSSNPPVQRLDVPAASRNAPVIPSGVPVENVIQKQLERIPATVSVWGLIAPSKEHRESLSLALSRLTVPTDITPEAMVALVLPLLSKHSVTFKGLWIPTMLIDNGSAMLRVAYRLGIAKKDFQPSNQAVKAYDSTRRVVEGTIILKLDAEGFEMDVEVSWAWWTSSLPSTHHGQRCHGCIGLTLWRYFDLVIESHVGPSNLNFNDLGTRSAHQRG